MARVIPQGQAATGVRNALSLEKLESSTGRDAGGVALDGVGLGVNHRIFQAPQA